MEGPQPPPSPVIRSTSQMDLACAALLAMPARAPAPAPALSPANATSTDTTNVGTASASTLHMVAVVVDAGPQLVTFFVDGIVCDGGGIAAAGFQWTAPGMDQLLGVYCSRIGCWHVQLLGVYCSRIGCWYGSGSFLNTIFVVGRGLSFGKEVLTHEPMAQRFLHAMP